MQEEKKFLGTAILNADDAGFSLGEHDVVNLEGFRTGSTDVGIINTLEAIGGTRLISSSYLAAGTNYCIGGADDLTGRRRLFFIWNSNGDHRICCFDYTTTQVYIVLLNSDLQGGLNFGMYNYINAARVANGCLYWTDSINEPCRIDINAGINLHQPGTYPQTLPYTLPIKFPVVRIIRREPAMPPTQIKGTDLTYVNNFIKYEAFQFAVRYQYRNYEYSKLSPLSTTANYNKEADTYNFITVGLSQQELIDQDVIRVDLVVYYISSATYFIIKSWTSVSDSAAIASHNSGGAPLSFAFYNDFLGTALDYVYAVTPFDNVPLLSKTLEVAKNRLFLGNSTFGYDTPLTSSITLAPKLGSGPSNTVTGLWIKFIMHSVCGGYGSDLTLYLLDISDIPDTSNPGYYVYVPGGVPPYPASVNYALCSFRGQGIFDVMNYYSPGCTNTISLFQNTGNTSVINNAPAPPFVIGLRAVKSDSAYQATITFYDYAGRKSGVVNTPAKIHIPDRIYTQVTFVVGLNWTLDNTNAINEIPPWAYTYSVNLTKCLRTRFFVQLRVKNATYSTKDADGNLVFNTPGFAITNEGCAFDISLLQSYSMGYVYNVGDIIKIYSLAGPNYQLAITGQSGNWVTTELKNLGTLNSTSKLLFEIYTPYKATASEPYYEQGQIFPVNNPTQGTRSYSVTNGTFNGDITLTSRNDGTVDYLVETMSPNDKEYKNWNTDAGRPNFIDTIGQTKKTSTIAYSTAFVQGSRVNGLSTFDVFNSRDIPSELGDIMKLQLTSKVQVEGSIMLAICNGSETASLYLGEKTLASTTGNAAIMGSDEVIGTINPLKGSRGTLNPESVYEYRGRVMWVDIQNGAVVQYSDNGLFDISDLKMTRYWELMANQFRSMTSAQIAAMGDRPFMTTCVDSYHDEYCISVPKLLNTPPKGYLPDYPSVIYPFDIWDGQGKTIFFKVKETLNKWQGAMPFVAESMFSIENNFYSFKNGSLYMHNDTNAYGNFYGVQHNAKVMTVSNNLPSKPKTYKSVAIESNMVPAFSYLYTKYPYVQSTDLVPDSFTIKEGIFYSRILRNKLDPKYWPDMQKSLLRGDEMRAVVLYVMYEFDVSKGIGEVKFINFGYIPSLGHTV